MVITMRQLLDDKVGDYPNWEKAEGAIRESYVAFASEFTPDFTAGDLVRHAFENGYLIRGLEVNGVENQCRIQVDI